MTSIAQNQGKDQREMSATLKRFFTEYRTASLLRGCRGEKRKGVSAFEVFRYLLCPVFSDRSMCMQIMTGRYTEGFSKNAVYPFLNAAKTNWATGTIGKTGLLSSAQIPALSLKKCCASMGSAGISRYSSRPASPCFV